MKKSVLFIFFILGIFILPQVYSAITIDSTLNPQYNLGEKINLKGSLTEASDVNGILNIFMECGTTTTEYRTITVNETIEVDEEVVERKACYEDDECSGEEVCWEHFCKDFNSDGTETVTRTVTEPITTTSSSQSVQLAAKSLRLKKDTLELFSYDLPITGELLGTCSFKISFNDMTSGTLIDETTSSSLEITKQLKGVFAINKPEFQLGDDIIISGNILNLKDININGMSVIYIKKDGINYIVDTVPITAGAFNYKTKLISMPAGAYSVFVEASDNNGNKYLFENALQFNLYNNLIVSGLTDKQSYLPEEIVKITGTVYKKIGGAVSGVKVNINFDDKNYTTDILEGKFTFNIPLLKTIKSYYHNISFNAEDQSLNYGEDITKIDVIPVPTTLSIELDKEAYQPQQTVLIKPILNDQASDALQRKVDIEIRNTKNDIVFSIIDMTGNEVKYDLPEFAYPGIWKINIKSEGLKATKDLNVEVVEIIDILLSGQELSLTNLGNDKFEDEVSIEASGEVSDSSIQKFYLKPNETKTIELFKLFKPGTYSIKIMDKTFDSVTILDERNIFEKALDGLVGLTGYTIYKQSKDISNMGFTSLAIIGVIVLLGLLVKYGGKLKFGSGKKAVSQPENIDFDKPGVQIVNDKIGKSIPIRRTASSLRNTSGFGKANEQDIADFKRRIRAGADKDRRFGSGNGGAFSMFD
ncbi:MAG: hypothetical protein WC413_01005 [Candidatus Nanoarchaeia archaeon]